jgi:hypothetical protein
MFTPPSGPPRRAFLLGCWQEGVNPSDGTPIWRFALEAVDHKSPRKGFGALAELMQYVRDQLQSDNAVTGELKS